MKNPFLTFILFLFLFSGCEQEEFTLSPEKGQTIETREKAGGDCRFGDYVDQIVPVEICGAFYDFHVSLELLNAGNFHRLQALAKCYKQGDDPRNYIEHGIIEVKLDGNMHIWCQEPIDVQEPSDYNKNLVFGEVPYKNQCENCGNSSVTLDYWKNLTIIRNQDLVEASFLLKLEECGEFVETFVTLQL